jgi:hypothetical protein
MKDICDEYIYKRVENVFINIPTFRKETLALTKNIDGTKS